MESERDKRCRPMSCDTFAVLPPGNSKFVVFGKNSDRPDDEVQEVVYVPATDHPCPSKLKCTYIEIDQVAHTHAVVLSKPAWMWGAEMGSNEHGVTIGNEAVWTKLNSDSDLDEKLLGMDLLRLGLERSTTALEAVYVITSLLETHGQGGHCSNTMAGFTYHNSFLIADPTEVWILETAAQLWAAEKITSGVRNISNELSITTQIELSSPNLKRFAEENNFWSACDGEFNFMKAYGIDDTDEDDSFRYKSGRRLLKTYSASGNFGELEMFKVLRDKPSGICMSTGSFVSTGSQVSVLRSKESGVPSCHWFTGTPDPLRSVFKPFMFADDLDFPPQIVSPAPTATEDLRHELYKCQQKYRRHRRQPDMKLVDFESSLLSKVQSIISDFSSKKIEVKCLFKDAVETEMRLLDSLLS